MTNIKITNSNKNQFFSGILENALNIYMSKVKNIGISIPVMDKSMYKNGELVFVIEATNFSVGYNFGLRNTYSVSLMNLVYRRDGELGFDMAVTLNQDGQVIKMYPGINNAEQIHEVVCGLYLTE